MPIIRALDQRLRRWFRGKNYLLFVALSVGIITLMLTGKEGGGHVKIRLLFTVVFLACVYTTSTTRRYLVVSVLLLAPGLFSDWLLDFIQAKVFAELSLTGQAIFLMYSAFVILRQIFFFKHLVTIDTILGAINIYLLIGIIWTLLFLVSQIHNPDAFRLPNAPKADQAVLERFEEQAANMTYFSFVTLATVGYGDITPNIPWTKTLSIIEAIISQLYLAILVASLIGLRLQQSIAATEEDPLKI